MSLGSLKNLYMALSTAPTLAGMSVVYGEEFANAQDYPLPLFVIMPKGGPFTPGQGYIKGMGQTIQVIWMVDEQIDVAVWASAGDSAQPIDNADATENAAALMLQALANQRPSGLTYRPVARNWSQMQGAVSRFGRGLILSFVAQVPIPGVTPSTATVTSIEIDESIT
jgi:hypothetical protein